MEQNGNDRLCRDCARLVAPPPMDARQRCPICHGPRLLKHAEIRSLAIAHIDCDAFYAAVEKRDDPDLENLPLIIGGGRRGVVSTCCYLARMYGVHSAMPMFKALELCPDATVLKPDMAKYTAVSRHIRNLFQTITPAVEPISVDEAFLDLSGTERVHGALPAETLARLAATIEREVGITVSIGLSYNKFLAKVASDLDKPRGFFVIGRAEAVDFLRDKPVSIIWGVGKALERKLARDGIHLIGQLQAMVETTLVRKYGSMGFRLHAFSRGNDARQVDLHSVAKSISSETTFDQDKNDYEDFARILWSLSENVATSLKKKHFAGTTVTLKLKTTGHRLLTRSNTLDSRTQLAMVIYEQALALLKPMLDGTTYRLVGVGVTGLGAADGADPPDLIEPRRTKLADAERAMDQIRDRFGKETVGKGRGLATS